MYVHVVSSGAHAWESLRKHAASVRTHGYPTDMRTLMGIQYGSIIMTSTPVTCSHSCVCSTADFGKMADAAESGIHADRVC